MNNRQDPFEAQIGAMPPAPPNPFGGDEEAGPNPVAIVHRLFRGRYLWALILGVVLAVPAAIGGYTLVKPKFTSTANIRVETKVDTVIYSLSGTEEMRNFNTFVNTQVALVQRQRVVSMAVENVRENHPSWPAGAAGLQRFYGGLSVTPQRNAPIVNVSFTDEDPVIARDAATALIDAFQTLYVDEQVQRASSQRRDRLEDLVVRHRRDLDAIEQRLASLENRYGTLEVGQLQAARSERLAVARQELLRLENAFERASEEPERVADIEAAAALDSRELRRLAELDSALAALMNQELSLNTRLLELGQTFGPEHREIKQLTRRLETVRSQISERATEVQLSTGDAAISTAQLSPDQIDARITDVTDEIRILERELDELVETRQSIADATSEQASYSQLLSDAQTELSRLVVELDSDTDLSRLSTLPGELPFGPSTDRRVPLAGMGAMAGMGLSFALFGAIGWLRLGVEYISDLDSLGDDAPLIGVVPDLDQAGFGGDNAAALAVHHVRNLLQVYRAKLPRGCRIYTITSPTSGDGKTSFTQALALSFAAVGHKTLAIDADMIGHGLSRQFGLGEEPGLWQGLEGERLDRCTHETDQANLWVMPTGAVHQSEPERLGRDHLGELMQRLRDDFDTIVIDTGPLLGSLDASLGASASDEAVLVVGRGQRPKLVKAAVERFRSVGTGRLGIVFNRARWEDVRSTANAVSLTSQSQRAMTVEEPEFGKSARARRSLAQASTEETGGMPKL